MEEPRACLGTPHKDRHDAPQPHRPFLRPLPPPGQAAGSRATLKSGKEVCLDPSARWVKLIISRILKQVPSNL
ncbi:hypothetical protein JD844_002403 [Phrynosoma platyrhinos]|uniref:Chemokine interleukin-8-like domain-containing protein n=1 Tax=Phrynosoma platyrhinos TaxID=52577 RepID=A0ABQ7TBX7_PHRPL|nr:hypothetical protein JD844_002403 [Phrynosoma platyrhinos]